MSRKLRTYGTCARCSCARRTCGCCISVGSMNALRRISTASGSPVQYGIGLAHQALERPGAGEVFVATVRAIEIRTWSVSTNCLQSRKRCRRARQGCSQPSDGRARRPCGELRSRCWSRRNRGGRKWVSRHARCTQWTPVWRSLGRSGMTMCACARARCSSRVDADVAIWSTPASPRLQTRTSAARSRQRGPVCCSAIAPSR